MRADPATGCNKLRTSDKGELRHEIKAQKIVQDDSQNNARQPTSLSRDENLTHNNDQHNQFVSKKGQEAEHLEISVLSNLTVSNKKEDGPVGRECLSKMPKKALSLVHVTLINLKRQVSKGKITSLLKFGRSYLSFKLESK